MNTRRVNYKPCTGASGAARRRKNIRRAAASPQRTAAASNRQPAKKRPRQTAGQNKKCLPSHKYGFPYPPNAKTGILGWNDAKNEFYKFNLCLYT